MKTVNRFTVTAQVAAWLLTLGACSDMSTRDKNTAVGAAGGAVAGSILTGGSTGGAVGGAIVGGVIGHEVNKK